MTSLRVLIQISNSLKKRTWYDKYQLTQVAFYTDWNW
jgi:hypothetical protein